MLLRLNVLVVLLAVAAVGTVGWIAAERAIHRPAVTYPWRLADYPALTPQPVTFISRTGTRLAARFFPGRSRATTILSHGYGDNQEQMLPWAAFLHRAGYSVFTYDMRSRGHSGGSAITFGALEYKDLISAVDYLVPQLDVDAARLGALGLSLGGSATVLAAQDRRIRAVVDDCGVADMSIAIDSSFAHVIHLPAFPFAPVAVLFAAWRTGSSADAVRPIERVARIGPRPVFFVHGTADAAIPPSNSARLFAAARQPKALLWVRGAGHWQSLRVAGPEYVPEYVRRVVAFFERYVPP